MTAFSSHDRNTSKNRNTESKKFTFNKNDIRRKELEEDPDANPSKPLGEGRGDWLMVSMGRNNNLTSSSRWFNHPSTHISDGYVNPQSGESQPHKSGNSQLNSFTTSMAKNKAPNHSDKMGIRLQRQRQIRENELKLENELFGDDDSDDEEETNNQDNQNEDQIMTNLEEN